MTYSKIRNEFELRDIALLFFCATAILLFVTSGTAQTTAFVQQAKLVASDGAAQDSHGFSVAISGDTAIVGAPRNSGGAGLQSRGSAYIYVRSVAGVWTQQQKLAPSDGVTTDQFGYSVAINGNSAAVGRYNTTTGQNRADGKVYIFTRTGNVWTETQTLVSSDIAQGDLFGNSLAFENDTLVVGALNKNNGNNFFQGAAYVFTRSGAGANFTQQAKLTASDGVFADFFGYSVAVSGDSVIVGATSLAGQPNSKGKAYIFTRAGSSWTQQQILQASDGANGDAFGYAVGISNDTAIVGARLDAIGTTGEIGSAYVFNRSGGAWTEAQKLTAAEATPRNDTFGGSVAIKGDTIAIGSPAHEFVGSIANHGAVYVFRRGAAGSFTRTEKLIHNDVAPDALGTSVAFDGASIISGAPSKDSARGASYIFNQISTNNQSKLLGEAFVNPQYGQSAAISGDTAAVGSNLGVYIFNRSGANWGFVQKIPATVNGTTTISPGSSIAISGDTMVIGASGSRINGNFGQGAALVYIRSGAIWAFQQQLLASDGATGDQFGNSVAISGETIVIGSQDDAVGANGSQGSAFIFTRNGTVWTQQQKLLAGDGEDLDFFGAGVAISGDTVVVGADDDDFGSVIAQGSAYVFTRSDAGAMFAERTKIFANDGGPSDRFGKNIAIEGSTIVVGSYQNNSPTFRAGAAYVFTGSGATWTQQQKLAPSDGATFDGFGWDVDISGDRIVVGSFNANNARLNIQDTGAVYVYARSDAAWNFRGKLLAFDGANGDQLGTSAAVSNNYVVAGAVGDDLPGVTDQGSAYVFNLNNAFAGSGTADFDGDGKADLSVFRPSNGTWYFSGSQSGFSGIAFGTATDKIVPADYDGDGKTDVAVYRGGIWYLQRSQAGFVGVTFGASDDVPVSADYDGDGKADIAVYRPSNGGWYRINSSNNEFFAVQFGASEDKPTLGDYDGDGKADVAVYRPSNGTWYRINSSNNQVVSINFGAAEDSVVPADYDGDGKTDVAVFRPSSGTWYLQQSQLGFSGIAFGQTGDKPVPADYDGDGKADVAVFRDGTWYLNRSQAGFLGAAFGAGDDLPAPNAFVR